MSHKNILYSSSITENHEFYCIYHRSLSTDSFLQLEMSKVVELCFSASSAVSHIVNNLSPEGHLPMDFTGINFKKLWFASNLSHPKIFEF